MLVKIKNLKPNPFRRMNKYPIDQAKVEALKNSINETEFWDNILARPKPNHSSTEWDYHYGDIVVGKEIPFKEFEEYEDKNPEKEILTCADYQDDENARFFEEPIIEIAYGHHRLVALQELGIEKVDISVKDLDDATMIKIMANENMDNWQSDVRVINETVAVAKEYLDNELKKYKTFEEFNVNKNINVKLLFSSGRQFQEVKNSKEGVGATTILKFLGSNWKQYQIQNALAILKAEKENKLDREAVETFKLERHAREFKNQMIQKKIPKEKQKEYANEIVKEFQEEEKEPTANDIREKVYKKHVEEKKKEKPELFEKSKLEKSFDSYDIIHDLKQINKYVDDMKEKVSSLPEIYREKFNTMIDSLITKLTKIKTL